jgi:GNAT superfamily N-acetyltransferase
MIYSKWLRTHRYGNEYFKLIDSDAYYTVYKAYINVILNRPNTIVKLAVLTDEPDTVLGFSVVEGSALHYVWSHKDNRGIGIARALVPPGIEYITHLTKIGMSLWNSKLPNAKFNPFI